MTTARTIGSSRNKTNNSRSNHMNKSDSIASLAAALAKAQGEVENASKASVNPHFKSRYADLAEVINTVRPVFAKNGLAVTQFPSYSDGIVSVETVLTHSSGEWMSGTISAPVSKQDAQGVGSATTYCRRYALAAVAGIAQEDDDANSAVGHSQKSAKADRVDVSKALASVDACDDLESLRALHKEWVGKCQKASDNESWAAIKAAIEVRSKELQ